MSKNNRLRDFLQSSVCFVESSFRCDFLAKYLPKYLTSRFWGCIFAVLIFTTDSHRFSFIISPALACWVHLQIPLEKGVGGCSIGYEPYWCSMLMLPLRSQHPPAPFIRGRLRSAPLNVLAAAYHTPLAPLQRGNHIHTNSKLITHNSKNYG